jgi:alkanesulfonate monooxygenase SsuD/methylene tetrahydromethanopterin reductase-like flavin-dependent oxidoreductase (luciferase family)
MGGNEDQIGYIDNSKGTFGKTYVGAPDKIVAELLQDEAVMAADTILVTVPNQLGAEFNGRTFEVLARDIKPALK